MTKKALLLSLLVVTGTSASLMGCQLGGGVDPYNLDFTVDTRGTTIDFWTGFGSDFADILENVLKTFEDETGIIVNHESKGGYDGLQQAITLSAGTNSYPNVALAYPDHMVGYVNNNIILRLDSFFEDDGDDTFNPEDFYPDYMKENYEVEYNRETGEPYLMGVPFNKSTEVMIYNKTFFEWAKTISGFEDRIFVPSTWDEVVSVSTAINELMEDYYGKFIGHDGKGYETRDELFAAGQTPMLDFDVITYDTFRPFSYDSQANWFITLCRQWGGEFTEVDQETMQGYLAFDSDEVKEGLQFMQNAYNDHLLAIPTTFGEAGYSSNPFKFLRCVMTVSSSAGVKNNVPQGNSFETGVAPVPYRDADHKYVISQGTNAILLDKGTEKELVASWKLLKYLTKTANGTWSAESGYFPTCSYAEESEVYQDFLNNSTSSIDRMNQATSRVNSNVYMNDAEKWTKFVDKPFSNSSRVRSTVESAMSQLFIDKVTPDQLIQNLYTLLPDNVRR